VIQLHRDKIVEGVWFSRVRVWHLQKAVGVGEGTGVIVQWGVTYLINPRNNGTVFIDEEAAKKSVTDGLTKCLSYLGLGADVHLGRFDDAKYVAELRKDFAHSSHQDDDRTEHLDLLQTEGVEFKMTEAEGKKYLIARGKTYGKNQVLKAAQFKWNPNRKVWYREAA